MADPKSMYVSYGTHQLVSIELDQDVWNHLFHLEIVLHDLIDCLGGIVHHYIQVDFIWLFKLIITHRNLLTESALSPLV